MRVGISWRRFSLLLAALAAATGFTAAVAAGGGAKTSADTPKFSGALTPKATQNVGRVAPLTKDGLAAVIVKLDVAPLASYSGGVRGLARTMPAAGKQIDLKSAAAQRYQAFVNSKIDAFEAAAAALLGRVDVTYRYDVVIGGVAMNVPPARIAALEKLPGVAWVERQTVETMDTDASPQFIGATTAWNAGQLGVNARGERVIVGVLDSGIYPEHPSYSPNPPGQPPFSAPPPPPGPARQCQFGVGARPGPAFTCNNKLIAAYVFLAQNQANTGPAPPGTFTDARDENGHGTHTSSTAAGNSGVFAQTFGIPRGQISGIAPRAHVIMYKVCGASTGSCFSGDVVGAVNRGIQDGADVFNYSISGGNTPYSDSVSRAFLDATNAGILVSASAGNSGPGLGTNGHNEPWTMTVAASNSNRQFLTELKLAAGNQSLTVPASTITSGAGPTQVVYAGSAPWNDPLCQNKVAGRWNGLIVLCDRGVTGRVDKSHTVFVGGGIAMILVNLSLLGVNTDNFFVPTAHVEHPRGTLVKNFVLANPGTQAQWNAGQAAPWFGDVIQAFSSRGGPGQTAGILKPDVTAPGIQILAGMTPQNNPNDFATGPQGQLFQSIAGTSMSSPHNAGGAALLAALQPNWSPGQIKSALMTTSKLPVFNTDGVSTATPFDTGSGRIDLSKAYNPGITFSTPPASFCETGMNSTNCTASTRFQEELYLQNTPSIYVSGHPGFVSVPRTAHSEVGIQRTWRLFVETSARDLQVSVPFQIIVPAGGDTTFSIDIDASRVPVGGVRHAHLRMTEVTDGAPRVNRIPITIVRKAANVSLNKTCNPTTLALNQSTHCTISMQNNTFSPAQVTMNDTVPEQLRITATQTPGAVVSGDGRTITWSGTLAASTPENPVLATGSSPGYFALNNAAIVAGIGDETIANFGVPAFTYAGNSYTTMGLDSNGFLIPGGISAADHDYQAHLPWPNTARPNNTVAPMWTDLDPSAAGGDVRVGRVTDGTNFWTVYEWRNVAEYSTPAKRHTFQAWFGESGDPSPGEDVSFTYNLVPANPGEVGANTAIGVENRFGNRGNAVYTKNAANATTGAPPAAGTEYRVTSTAAIPGTAQNVDFDAIAVLTGSWRNCATLTSNSFYGTATSCITGVVQ